MSEHFHKQIFIFIKTNEPCYGENSTTEPLRFQHFEHKIVVFLFISKHMFWVLEKTSCTEVSKQKNHNQHKQLARPD